MDNFMIYDFLIPGVLLMTSGVFPVGSAKALDFKAPDMADSVAGVTFTSQAVTPMREKTARYFFSWGPRRDHGDEALRDSLMKLADQAFAEDKLIIEAQQKVIDDTPNPQIMPTAHDRAVTLFNRLVERLAREEANPAHQAA
jgi:vanillate O-demethylase monooxygenase subunit